MEKISALLCEQSYRKQNAQLNVEGYALDNTFSKDNAVVYVDNKKKIVIMAIRGTQLTNKEDIHADISIIKGNFATSKRFKDLNKLFSEVKSKYSTYKIDLTGHSLGAKACIELLNQHTDSINKIYLFNAGASISDLVNGLFMKLFAKLGLSHAKKMKQKTVIYHIIGDPISFFARFHAAEHHNINPTQVNTHSLDNFTNLDDALKAAGNKPIDDVVKDTDSSIEGGKLKKPKKQRKPRKSNAEKTVKVEERPSQFDSVIAMRTPVKQRVFKQKRITLTDISPNKDIKSSQPSTLTGELKYLNGVLVSTGKSRKKYQLHQQDMYDANKAINDTISKGYKQYLQFMVNPTLLQSQIETRSSQATLQYLQGFKPIPEGLMPIHNTTLLQSMYNICKDKAFDVMEVSPYGEFTAYLSQYQINNDYRRKKHLLCSFANVRHLINEISSSDVQNFGMPAMNNIVPKSDFIYANLANFDNRLDITVLFKLIKTIGKKNTVLYVLSCESMGDNIRGFWQYIGYDLFKSMFSNYYDRDDNRLQELYQSIVGSRQNVNVNVNVQQPQQQAHEPLHEPINPKEEEPQIIHEDVSPLPPPLPPIEEASKKQVYYKWINESNDVKYVYITAKLFHRAAELQTGTNDDIVYPSIFKYDKTYITKLKQIKKVQFSSMKAVYAMNASEFEDTIKPKAMDNKKPAKYIEFVSPDDPNARPIDISNVLIPEVEKNALMSTGSSLVGSSLVGSGLNEDLVMFNTRHNIKSIQFVGKSHYDFLYQLQI